MFQVITNVLSRIIAKQKKKTMLKVHTEEKYMQIKLRLFYEPATEA